MAKQGERVLLYLIFAAFSVLLISGLPRLFFRAEEPTPWNAAVETSLCACAPSEPAASERHAEEQRVHTEKAAPPRAEKAAQVSSGERDANGNVLCGACYTACVFEAFAPEDGFS